MERVVDLWKGCGHWTCLTNLVAEFLQLLFREDGLVKLGKELVHPNVESQLLNPKSKPGADEDPGNSVAGLFPVDGFPVSFTIGKADRVVQEADVAGIGSAIGNEIVSDFLFHFRPSEVSQQENFVNFCFGEGFSTTQCSGFASAEVSQEPLCVC